ncbi:glycosyltransferase family 2 protein [Pedobacter nutrimenti]|uniref:glycosyltransferase family 2 protein n=1 Tax=Pedobacter nutrimenti TaxID=1241337 RepID=UPI00292CC0DB|nr:glycosyltransferase [Pedobacter nutrimenti]
MHSPYPVMVSVCCITYNHENYITQALESFLMQETNFEVEILVGEDCSTDNTKAIIAEYAQRYPGKIQLIAHQPNKGAVRNQIDVMSRAKGKYIAMCDGDDFWIDPFKLQKQVDFLESHEDGVICCTYSRVIDENDQVVYEHPEPRSLEFDYPAMLMGLREETRICSLMVRNIQEVMDIKKQQWYYHTHGSDTLFKLYAAFQTNHKVYVLPEVMSCYRLHAGGVWSMIDSRLRKSRMISDFNLMIRNFSYSAVMKRKLFKMYLQRYLLFDLRYLNIQQALTTIRTLL